MATLSELEERVKKLEARVRDIGLSIGFIVVGLFSLYMIIG